MSPEETKKLLERFPLIYSGYYLPEEESLMSRGFQCGDGWFKLIWQLSMEIETQSKALGIDVPQACEIKQKMGGLTYRIDSNHPIFSEIISEAAELSLIICEKCGRHGKWMRKPGLLQVLCEKHGKGFEPIDQEMRNKDAEIANAIEGLESNLEKAKAIYSILGYISVSITQRKLKIGYEEACEIHELTAPNEY